MKKMLKMGISFTMGAVALFALLTQGLCVHEFGQGIVTKNDTPIDDGSGTCNFSVDSLEQTLSESKAAFVPGDSLWSLLAARGALAADVPKLAAMWSEAIPQRDERGRNVYPFKVICFGSRSCFFLFFSRGENCFENHLNLGIRAQ